MSVKLFTKESAPPANVPACGRTTNRGERTIPVEKVKILEIKQSVFASNDREADEVRRQLKEKGVFLLNLMSSPGSGKTTTLRRTIEALKDEIKADMQERGVEQQAAGNFLIRWTTVTANRFDSKAFQKEHETLYSQYLKQTVSRRFSIA